MRHATRMALFCAGYLGTASVISSSIGTDIDFSAVTKVYVVAVIVGQYLLFAVMGYFVLGKVAPSLFEMFLFSQPLNKKMEILRNISEWSLTLMGLDRSGNRLP